MLAQPTSVDKILNVACLAEAAEAIRDVPTTTPRDVPMDKVIAEFKASRQNIEEQSHELQELAAQLRKTTMESNVNASHNSSP